MENYTEKIQEAKDLYDSGKNGSAFNICLEIIKSQDASNSAEYEANLLICLCLIQDLSMADFDNNKESFSLITRSTILALEFARDYESFTHVLDASFDALSSRLTTLVDECITSANNHKDLGSINNVLEQFTGFAAALKEPMQIYCRVLPDITQEKYSAVPTNTLAKFFGIIDAMGTVILTHYESRLQAFSDMLDDYCRVFQADAIECLNRLALAETLLLLGVHGSTQPQTKLLRNKLYVILLCMKLQVMVVNDGSTYYMFDEEDRQADIQKIQELTAAIREIEPDYTPPSYQNTTQQSNSNSSSGGCYVATCVYGSYDCPEVWTLRRFRDNTLGSTWYGRAFIHTYYAISPTLVKWFGETNWFKKMWRGALDRMVRNLQDHGVADTPYKDKHW